MKTPLSPSCSPLNRPNLIATCLAAIVGICAPLGSAIADTEIQEGFEASISEITGPDDLGLNPDQVILAVDVFGNEDLEVNGVLFRTDRCDGCADTEGEIELESGVKYFSTSTHFIDGWAAPPIFTGGEGDSADNLAAIMEDIRWSAAPAPVTVQLEGLEPDALYKVQLLVNEGGDRDRRWDIGVGEDIDGELALVIDDFTSEGDTEDEEGKNIWTDENSFVATFNAPASGDGKLAVVMQQHIDGQDPPGGDNNPILQGVIISSTEPPPESIHGVPTDELTDATPDGWDLSVVLTTPIENEDGLLTGSIHRWSYYASDQRAVDEFVVRPLLIEQQDDIWTVVGVGAPHSPEDPGIQEDIPFDLQKGTASFSNADPDKTYHVGFIGQRPDFGNNEAGGIVPFGENGPGMFAMDTDPETDFEPGDEFISGHASDEGGRNYMFHHVVRWSTNDQDGDGIPDAVEEKWGLDPEDKEDAASDKDNDGLTAFQELIEQDPPLDPTKPDTDGDGLKDGDEVAGAGQRPPTSPALVDTDGDNLSDNHETNTGTFVDEEDTGTDPTKADTDGDKFTDDVEIRLVGGDPLDPNVSPEAFPTQAGDLDVDSWPGPSVDGWDITIIHVEPVEVPDGFTTGIVDTFNFSIADGRSQEDGYTLRPLLVKRNTDTGETIFHGVGKEVEFPEGGSYEGIEVELDNGSFLVVNEPNTSWHAAFYNGHPDSPPDADGGAVTFGPGSDVFGMNTSPDDPPTAGDEVVANHNSHDAPSGRIYNFNLGFLWNDADSDGDTIPDIYEDANGLDRNVNDAEGDKDEDGATNLAEFKSGSDPQNADTDGDGLKDGVETGTGTWVDENNRGTSATSADTDGDGLPDGVETNTGTFVSATDTGSDPHKTDTDGDGETDGVEVPVTNPNDPNDKRLGDPPRLLALWTFDEGDGDAVDSVGEVVAVVDGPTYVEGRTGEAGDMALQFEAGGGAAHIEDAGFFNLVSIVDQVSIVLWQKNLGTPDSSTFWFNSESSSGGTRGAQAHIPWSNNNVYWDTVGCCAGGAERVNGDPAAIVEGEFDWTDEEWHHWVFWKDGEEKRVYVDGEEFLNSSGGKPFPDDFFDGYIGGDGGGGNNPDAVIDEFAVFAYPLSQEEIDDIIENGIGGGSRLPFQITQVGLDGDGLSLTWDSRSNAEYSIEYKANLDEDVWIELDDGVASEGAQTTWTDDDQERLGLANGWYRIRQN